MKFPLPEALTELYPYAPKTLALPAGQMSYLDEGEGDTVIMLHGNPTWSFFYRGLVKGLSTRYRCLVPDHLGMGLSDKPKSGFSYHLGDHIQNVVALVEALKIERFHLIVHDWGGAIGMGLARHFPGRVGKLVVMNTAAFRSMRMPASIGMCRWPLLGEFFVRSLNGFVLAAQHRAMVRKPSRRVRAGYLFPYRDWASRIGVYRFVKDIPMRPKHPSYQTLLEIEESLSDFKDNPMLLLWGLKDFCFNHTFLNEWKRRFPKAKSVELADAGHYLLEDKPDNCLIAVATFLDEAVVDESPKRKKPQFRPKPPTMP